MKDTDLTILKDFGDAMRPVREQGLQAMAAAKTRLVANGISGHLASQMLDVVMKQLNREEKEAA